ncbi:RAMP superfamily CRISPR-associated protein [Alkalinema pantanalense CENA528]|uniref:RAMP superfamily CRISPR-associated protein n=1 Tax=Alkalinema pantanalense TaxID=1620705 RepID=UPI003D6E92D5
MARQDDQPKAFDFVSFPGEAPKKKELVGHDRWRDDRFHGVLQVRLTVETALHSSTGNIVLGRDVGVDEPLVGPLVQRNGQWIIQGSSLKGCVRSVYEAITNSTLGTKPNKDCRVDRSRLPMKAFNDRKNPSLELCPASRVFGAMGFQGLVEIGDAVADRAPSIVRVQPLFAPQLGPGYEDAAGMARGRKFYYHGRRLAEGGSIPIQAVMAGAQLTTQIRFKNLESADLGALLVALGLDEKYRFALKLGAAKPLGLGTVSVEVTQAEISNGKELQARRYADYVVKPDWLTGKRLHAVMRQHITIAHQELIQKPQLEQLVEILKFPTDREPIEGIY